jgi:uncharacterized protein (DUF1501 family)
MQRNATVRRASERRVNRPFGAQPHQPTPYNHFWARYTLWCRIAAQNTMNRRDFIKGCTGFAAVAAARGFGISDLIFDANLRSAHAASVGSPDQPPPNNRDLLVLVFVRGGLDGLNVVVPFNTSPTDRARYYNQLRPTMNIPPPDSSAARKAIDLDGRFGLHPDAARGFAGVNTPNQGAFDTGGLLQLFRNGDLAIVDACGSLDITGSHFDTELYVDFGGKNAPGGWVARYLDAIGEPNDALAVSPQAGISPSLASISGRNALAVPNADAFGPQWRTNGWMPDADRAAIITAQRAIMQQMMSRGGAAPTFVESVGRSALTGLDMLSNVFATDYKPSASYLTDTKLVLDYGRFGNSLQTVAQIAKASIANPLRVATIDVGGGYDTHDNQGTLDWNGNARFSKLLTNLSTNLKAFYDDMNASPEWRGRFVVAVVSEFGRVLYQNASGGCDHGAGNIMMLIGSPAAGKKSINGGAIYGEWPGLQRLGFNDGLQITTDYRRVLAEILNKRMAVTTEQINTAIFPGLGYASGLGVAGVK